MESAGMMKMATGEGFPLRQGAGTGLDCLLVATEASGGGTPDLFCSPIILGYMDIYIGGRNTLGEPRGAHEGEGRAQGWWARPLPRGFLVDPPTCTPSLLYCFLSKNKFREVSVQLDSV